MDFFVSRCGRSSHTRGMPIMTCLRSLSDVRRKPMAAQIAIRKLSSGESVKAGKPENLLAENLEYCMRIVEERDYENFIAAMLMPAAARPSIIAMLALNAEVSVVRQKIRRNSGVAGIYQLQFWQDAIKVWARQQKGILPRQPAIACLKAYGVPHEDVDLMLRLVAARLASLGDRPFKTLADLETNAVDVHGSVMRLWANALVRQHVNRPSDPITAAYCSREADFNLVVDRLAKSVGIAILLRGTLLLLKEGIVLLPEDVMSAHKLNADKVFSNRNPDATKRMIVELCEVSRTHLDTARKSSANVDKRLRPVLMSSAFRAEYITGLLHAGDGNIFASRLQQRHPFLAWKMWWRNWRGVY